MPPTVTVAAGRNGQVFPGTDAAARIGQGAHAGPVTNLNRGAIVDDVALERDKADLAGANLAGHGVANAVLRQYLQVVAGLDQPALVDAAGALDVEVVAGAKRSDVDQIAAGEQVQVPALDQAAAAYVAVIRLGQVQHRHEDFLPVDDAVFHPDNVMGQRADLLARQRDAKAQTQRVFAGEGVIHQVAVLVVIAGQTAGEKTLAGFRQHRIANQALLVQAIAESTPSAVGVDVQQLEQVVRTKELRQVREVRVGLDQVAACRVGVLDEQPVIALGRLEIRPGRRVHGCERQPAVIHRLEDGLYAAIRRDTLDGLHSGRRHGGGTGRLRGEVDIDLTYPDAGLVVAQRTGQLFERVLVQRAVLHGTRDAEVDGGAGLNRGGVGRLRVVGPDGDIAALLEAAVAGTRFQQFEAGVVVVPSGNGRVEGRDVDVLHLIPITGGNAPRCTDHDGVLPGASGRALVEQVIGNDGQVVVGGQQAVAVLHA